MKAKVTPSGEYAGRLVVELMAEGPFEGAYLEMFNQANPTFSFDATAAAGVLTAVLEPPD